MTPALFRQIRGEMAERVAQLRAENDAAHNRLAESDAELREAEGDLEHFDASEPDETTPSRVRDHD